MQIKAKDKYGAEVTIVAFVSRYNKTYAVAIRKDGSLWDYLIENLTVLDKGA